MSMRNLAHACSHLQNASMANLTLTSIRTSRQNVRLLDALLREGFISGAQRGDKFGIDKEYKTITFDNIKDKRLWVTLKYDKMSPVLKKISLISKPSRQIILNEEQLKNLRDGKQVLWIKPENLGEVIFVKKIDESRFPFVTIRQALSLGFKEVVPVFRVMS